MVGRSCFLIAVIKCLKGHIAPGFQKVKHIEVSESLTGVGIEMSPPQAGQLKEEKRLLKETNCWIRLWPTPMDNSVLCMYTSERL